MMSKVIPSETPPLAKEKPSFLAKLAAMYHYGTALDMALITVGCLAKCAEGVAQTYVLIIFSDFFEVDGGKSYIEMGEFMLHAMCVFGGIVLGTEAVGSVCLELSKNRQIAQWKKGYVKGVLRQEVGWYDVNKPQELSTRMGESLVLIEKGLGAGTAGILWVGLGQLICGLIIGFLYKWDLALVTLATSLLTFVPSAVYSMSALDKKTKMLSNAYGEAGGVASETLAGLRTVVSLGLEPTSLTRYERCLHGAERAVVSTTKKLNFALSTMDASMFLVLAAGSLYAVFLMYDEYKDTEFVYSFGGTPFCAHSCDQYDLQQLDFDALANGSACGGIFTENGSAFSTPAVSVPFKMTCATGTYVAKNSTILQLFTPTYDNSTSEQTREQAFEEEFTRNSSTHPCVLTLAVLYTALNAIFQGVFSIAQLSPPITTIIKASRACNDIIGTIGRVPPIDSFSDEGATLTTVRGEVEMRNVVFAYPSAPDFFICNGYSLHIAAGTSCALVGPSGSGKSTIVSLLERFYDPHSGELLLDGVDIKTLNLKWLRRQLGLVGQEPMLFLGTVADNIRLGKPDATDEEVEKAATAANAHEFITKTLNHAYKTQVGLGGGKLSGGQKQRLAIARAIIKKPTIMLLDEATSALDNASEKIVQAALDEIMSKGQFTSIAIAHRLSTVMHSNKIAVVQKGAIVEQGTYDELLAIGEAGVFYQLAAKQQANRASDAEAMAEANVVEAVGAGPTGEEASKAGPGTSTRDSGGDLEKGGGGIDGDIESGGKKGKKGGKKEKKPKEKDPMGRLFTYATPGDGPLYFLGIVTGGLTGVARGFFGLLMMRSITALAPSNPDTLYDDGLLWSLIFVGVGVGVLVLNTISWSCLSVAGEHLTKNLRLALLEKLLHFEVGYFDFEENSMGALTEFLGQKVTLLQGLVGEKLGMMAQSIVMLITTVFTMFYWGDWRITLVVLGCMPITGIIMSIGMQAMMPMGEKQGQKDKDEEQNKSAGSIVGEVVLGIRTVASFNAEQHFYNDYVKQVNIITGKGVPRAFTAGTINGLAMGIMYLIFGVQMYYGYWLMDVGALINVDIVRDASGCVTTDLNAFFDKVMVPIMAMFMVMMQMATMAMMATDASSASEAAKQLFERFDRKSLCDPFDEAGETLKDFEGRIQLSNVVFAYPTSPAFMVCNGYSLEVEAGKVCALCGPSGSGKSTIVALLQRFYDPHSGDVLLDGVDIKTLNVKWLRNRLGLVGQEPVLFEGTVAANIGYGKEGATQAEIEEAATAANAHTFITTDLGDGYNTQVGLRGGKLSGGQKQRVAIARALVRKPTIMLLDEATSALDNTSEKIVQAALDEIMSKQKRTTVTIAHRLSTIRNADTIAVVSSGRVAEQGTHDELLKIGPKGVYFGLVQAQQ